MALVKPEKRKTAASKILKTINHGFSFVFIFIKFFE